MGYYGRLELLERHGNKLHIKPSHLELAERWFENYGAPAVFFSRMLPIVRTFISLPAGVARMPFWRFTTLTLPRLHPVGLRAHLRGQAGGGQLDELEGQPALRRLRRRRADRRRHRLPRRAPAPPPGRCARPELRAAPRARARRAARAGRAAARLLVRPHELVPWLLGWSYAELDGELRKAFEVALHAGTAAALLLALRDEVGEAVAGFDARTAGLIAGSFVPPAVVGLAFERPIERRLGGPGVDRRGAAAGLGWRCSWRTAAARALARARRPGWPTRCGSASRRRAR